MKDWQGCLEPLAQQAWNAARDAVARRGGSLVSVEDYLLALLATHPSLNEFLMAWSIDIDELIRTIQSEQSCFELASSTEWLVEWWHCAQEQSPGSLLGVGLLLRVLCQDVDSLAQKAYVAVLQLVPGHAWGQLGVFCRQDIRSLSGDPVPSSVKAAARPLFGLHQEARSLAVQLLSPGYSVIWVKGVVGGGKSSLMLRTRQVFAQINLDGHITPFDWSRPESLVGVSPVSAMGKWWLLERCRPSDAVRWLNGEGAIFLGMIRRGEVRLLLEGSSFAGEGDAFQALLVLLGCRGFVFAMPLPDAADALAILRLHQSSIERQCRIELQERDLEAAIAVAMGREEADGIGEGVVPGLALHHLAVMANQRMLQQRLEQPILARLRDLRADRLTRQVVGLARESVSAREVPVEP